MAARYFCDGCGDELESGRTDRLRRHLNIEGNNFGVEVMVRFNGTWNTGLLCHACVVRVVTEGDDFAFNEGWLATKNRINEEAMRRATTTN